MAGRPIGRETIEAVVARLANRVDALERRRPVAGHYEIKLFGDDEAVAVGDGRFTFGIPFDLDKAKLRYVNAYVTTTGSGLTTIQIHNLGSAAVPAAFDMLNVPITIDAGEKDSETAATPWEIAGQEPAPATPSYAIYGFPYTDNTVFFKQQIRIDIDAAGSGAMGLGIQIGFDN
jgi:hypothetical protein